MNEILQSGRLCRPQSGQFSGVYQDIYDDALQELLLYICQNIEKYDIELDPENLFKKEYIVNYPSANFQAIAIQRFSGKSWKEVSEEFELKVSTVSSFYSRCLNKFSEKLKEYCSDYIT